MTVLQIAAGTLEAGALAVILYSIRSTRQSIRSRRALDRETWGSIASAQLIGLKTRLILDRKES